MFVHNSWKIRLQLKIKSTKDKKTLAECLKFKKLTGKISFSAIDKQDIKL